MNLNGGGIYAPAALLALSGSAQLQAPLVVGKLTISAAARDSLLMAGGATGGRQVRQCRHACGPRRGARGRVGRDQRPASRQAQGPFPGRQEKESILIRSCDFRGVIGISDALASCRTLECGSLPAFFRGRLILPPHLGGRASGSESRA